VLWAVVARVDIPIRPGKVRQGMGRCPNSIGQSFFTEAYVDVPVRPTNVVRVPIDVPIQLTIVVCSSGVGVVPRGLIFQSNRPVLLVVVCSSSFNLYSFRVRITYK